MLIFAVLCLLGVPDPMDIHAGDFLDESPEESLNAAAAAYAEGDWNTAAFQYLNALEIDPGNSIAIYNLSCCYGLMGKDDLSSLYLRRAFSAGFADLNLANSDRDFAAVRELPGFSLTIDSLNAASAAQNLIAGEKQWFDAVESFYYQVQIPEGFNPPEAVPLVVGLHGFGGSPDGFIRLWSMFNAPRFIFAVPQAPYPIGENSFSWYRGEQGTEEWGHSLKLAGEYVLALVEHLKMEYPVSDVYLLGFSQGGCLSLYTGLSEPDAFNAVIAASGWLAEDYIPSDWIVNSAEMRIELIHSREDMAVPFNVAERAEAVLLENGWNAVLHEIPGGHTVDVEELSRILSDLGLTGN